LLLIIKGHSVESVLILIKGLKEFRSKFSVKLLATTVSVGTVISSTEKESKTLLGGCITTLSIIFLATVVSESTVASTTVKESKISLGCSTITAF